MIFKNSEKIEAVDLIKLFENVYSSIDVVVMVLNNSPEH